MRGPTQGGAGGGRRGGALPPASGREAALQALVAIEAEGSWAQEAVRRRLAAASLDRRERALATELTYGATRRRRTLDAWLAPLSARPLGRLDPWTLASLRLALYQLAFLERVPERAAIHEAVELVRRYRGEGAARFTNAVLRAAQRERVWERLPASPGERYSLPDWLVAGWQAQLGGEEAEALFEALNRPPVPTLRANLLRVDSGALAARLRLRGIAIEPGLYVPEALRLPGGADLQGLPEQAEGLCSIQGEASMLVVHAVDPQPGEGILDVAAAPGGKATHLAERMGDRGRVWANDLHPSRVRDLARNAARLGLRSVEPMAGDGRNLPERFAGRADRVLLDAPCSGLGVLHARPDARWRRTPEQLSALEALQGELLQAAAACCRPGGLLVYSTCTTREEENLAQVRRLLALRSDFRLVPLAPVLPPALRAEPGAAEGWIQLWPHRHGVDGFFVARLARSP